MLGLPIAFTAPLVLIALAALPAIWLLLRVTPPQPRRIPFPPLRILLDLLPKRETPARTPWWLLALRLLVAALIILATAGPVWDPSGRGAGAGRGPIVLLIDNGVTAAHDWRERMALAADRVAVAERDGRKIAIVPTAGRADAPALLDPFLARDRLRAVQPAPHLADRRGVLDTLAALLSASPDAEINWIADGVSSGDGPGFVEGLARLAGGSQITIYKKPRAMALALAGADNASGALHVRVLRAESNGRDAGSVRALDLKGLPLGDAGFRFGIGATETSARFELPIEVRNSVARVDIADEMSAGAVTLLDESSRRRRIGLVTGATADVAQPLLSPTYYVSRALAPFADVREPRSGTLEAIDILLKEKISVLVLADVGKVDQTDATPAARNAPRDPEKNVTREVRQFIEEGGVLIRFAGSRLAAANDEFVPVRLRRGGRNLGGSLSWDTPKNLAPFARESPFFGLPARSEITVKRQMLAEPDGDLPGRTWASLADGTPIVTAERRGRGLIVLFHVTADPSWSNLPLSGIFVDMLRRIVALAGKPPESAGETQAQSVEMVAPQRTLDGFGAFRAPPATAKPVARDFAGHATDDHPPGLYGPNEATLAVNALVAGDTLAPIDVGPLNARIETIERAATIDLRAPVMTSALVLLVIDTLAALALGGYLAFLVRRRVGRATAAIVSALAVAGALAFAPSGVLAQEGVPLKREGLEAALAIRLAYVITGDGETDSTSRAGLMGLSQALSTRTALEPADPTGVDPARDELAFYPLLYWPVIAGRPLPNDVALKKIDAFMKGGGTIIFDTRDAISSRPGATSPEGQQLRRMLATLDIPELEPVPRDHVLTKAFFLVENFPGRYTTGQTWVEVLPAEDERGERRPARAGDGVSPIIITSNDLAAAWAVGRRGEALFPVIGSDPRQREMALRGGINIVIYALTGNYKADLVHVPALLERLGQ